MRLSLFMVLLLTVVEAGAWSNHAMLLWPVMKNTQALTENRLVVESLEALIRAEGAAIANTLDEVEKWSVANLDAYPPTPPELRFDPATPEKALHDFLAAIRVNPDLNYGLFRQGDSRRCREWAGGAELD